MTSTENPRRYLKVFSDNRKEVESYLPNNYNIIDGALSEGFFLVAGADFHGWTLEDYVIPRLASGWIRSVEMKQEDIV